MSAAPGGGRTDRAEPAGRATRASSSWASCVARARLAATLGATAPPAEPARTSAARTLSIPSLIPRLRSGVAAVTMGTMSGGGRWRVRRLGGVADPATARYDAIGRGYARTRRADPRFAARIALALGDARSVVNVGAGTGSYEPLDRHVVAIEPSDVMAEQRPRGLAPAIRASAAALPLRDRSVDAAMA